MQRKSIKIRFVQGLCTEACAMLLGKIVNESGVECDFTISEVTPSDADTLQDMVTSCALYVGDDLYDGIKDGKADKALLLIRKLCVAVRYAISGFKMTVDYGQGETETDCTLSIKVKNGHIHLPLDIPDKKLERFISISFSILFDKPCDDELLVYFDTPSSSAICETKDEYVRRKYFESGEAQG